MIRFARRWAAIALLSLLVTAVLANPLVAQMAPPDPPDRPETVLERVARTGVLTAGTRTDAPPFAYLNSDGDWVGYSIDMLQLIQQQLEQQLNQPIQLELVKVNVGDWISRLGQNELDIACGSFSITSSRRLHIDFSVGYFRTGTQFLVKRGHVLSPPELRLGVVRGASSEYSIEDQFRVARSVRFASRTAGLKALIAGQIDALASDGILLEGLRQTLPNPEAFEIAPAQPFNLETYGCGLPQNDPAFRAFVDAQLIAFMQAVLNNESKSVMLFDDWFGPTGTAPVDREQLLAFFQETIESYEQASGNQI